MNSALSRLALPLLSSLAAAICIWLALSYDAQALSWAAAGLCLVAGVSALRALRQQGRETRGGISRGVLWRMAAFGMGLLLIILVLGSLWLARDRARVMIHPGRSLPKTASAEQFLPDYQHVEFSTPDGLTLQGWYVPPRNRAVVIFLHGHGSNREQLTLDASLLVREGYGALLFDARNCGQSEGTITTFGLLEVNDVRGAMTFLQPQPEVDPERIGVLGHSMGGATAIMAAAQIPGLRAVVSESTYASLEENIRQRLDHLLGLPPFPFAPLVIFWGQVETGLDIQKASPVNEIAAISPRPLLLIHGALDETIVVENAYQLYQAAGQPKELVVLQEANHCCLPQVMGEAYAQKLLAFFNQALLSP